MSYHSFPIELFVCSHPWPGTRSSVQSWSCNSRWWAKSQIVQCGPTNLHTNPANAQASPPLISSCTIPDPKLFPDPSASHWNLPWVVVWTQWVIPLYKWVIPFSYTQLGQLKIILFWYLHQSRVQVNPCHLCAFCTAPKPRRVKEMLHWSVRDGKRMQ